MTSTAAHYLHQTRSSPLRCARVCVSAGRCVYLTRANKREREKERYLLALCCAQEYTCEIRTWTGGKQRGTATNRRQTVNKVNSSEGRVSRVANQWLTHVKCAHQKRTLCVRRCNDNNGSSSNSTRGKECTNPPSKSESPGTYEGGHDSLWGESLCSFLFITSVIGVCN